LLYANNNGVRIHYEVIGGGPSLVLQHGLGQSLEKWRMVGYVEPLAEKYQLILIDARGHGKSDKPYTPEKYSMELMVSDVVTVLDNLSIDKAHFYGYSMGGRIGLSTGKYASDRFNSLIIGGNGLSEKDSKPEMEELQGYIHIFRQGVEAVITFLENRRGVKLEDWERDEWGRNDLDALIAYCSYYENIRMADYLPKLTIPCLLYAGEKDTYPHSRAKACAEIMRNAEFLSFPGLDHAGAFNEISVVLPHILRFLEKVAKNVNS
jgi:pimeloyl-ACP methyl ester carboxylesterase